MFHNTPGVSRSSWRFSTRPRRCRLFASIDLHGTVRLRAARWTIDFSVGREGGGGDELRFYVGQLLRLCAFVQLHPM